MPKQHDASISADRQELSDRAAHQGGQNSVLRAADLTGLVLRAMNRIVSVPREVDHGPLDAEGPAFVAVVLGLTLPSAEHVAVVLHPPRPTRRRRR